MAEVFSNSMVAHIWAQQRQPYGRSNNGNFYFERETLYSYGTHFPVGIFAGPGGPVFLNSDSYSISTAKHKNDAWEAVRHIPERHYLPALASVRWLILSANARGKLPAEQRKPALAYLESQWAKLPEGSSGAAWLLRAAGSRATWPAMRARFVAKADAKAAREKAGLKAQAIKAGRELAARPWPDVKGEAWQGAANPYGQRELRETIKDCRAARLATPKAHKRVRSILWTYETRLRAILASVGDDSDRHGNPGNRTKARAVLSRLRRFKAGRIGFVPGYDGPDGEAKRGAALELPTGAGWRVLASLLNELAGLGVHVPTATRKAAERLYTKADGIATRLEGEEKQRRDVADARRRVRESLATFNRGRRNYRGLVTSGAWDGITAADGSRFLDGPDDRQKARILDSFLSYVPAARPWGAERGLELAPALAERAARIAARAEAMAAELEPIRDALRTAWERAEAERRAAERAERERVAAMTADERRAAWEAGEIDRQHVRDVETVSGPLLRAVAPEIDGCRVMGGTLETSQGATVPLRHAFRVFQFIALCRAKRKAWTPGAWGPRHIRVGHFSVDSVAVSGNFRAGCHAIQWAEVSRLAERLGVAGCLASLPELAAELAGEAA